MGKLIFSAFADEYSPKLSEQIEALKGLNYSHIELRFIDGVNIADISDEKLEELKKELSRAGISVSSIGSPIGKISIDGDFEEHKKKAERVFKIASELGAPFVRIFSFYIPKGAERSDYKDAVISRLKALVEIADKYNVTLCHENEADIFGESPEDCLTLLEALGNKLGCVLDMGNFVLGGYDVRKAYRLLFPHIRYFHIKDALYSGAIVPPGKGDALIKEVLTDYIEGAEGSVFATLEPHLQLFDGFNALTDRSFDNPYKYNTAKEAFHDAAAKLNELFK